LGISGFIHRAVRGDSENLGGVIGLILGGVLVAQLEGRGPAPLAANLPQVLLSGFLVGLGTKLASGCTSGHMLCGISRFSVRSIAASATFFATAIITTAFTHGDLSPISPPDWSLGTQGSKLLLLQTALLIISGALYVLNPSAEANDGNKEEKQNAPGPPIPEPIMRTAAYMITGTQFALALRLSNMTEFESVLGFLLLPHHHGFDSSLVFVAVGALSLGAFLYHYARGNETPRYGKWTIHKGRPVDAKLIIGSAIFGIGWGRTGVCPGPGLVNFGRALGSDGIMLTPYIIWLTSMIAGGLLADGTLNRVLSRRDCSGIELR